MEEELKKKIGIIYAENTDNSRLISKVIKTMEEKKEFFEEQKKQSKILNKTNLANNENIINLDSIWAKPYFYTNMRLKFEKIIELISETPEEEIKKNPNKFCTKILAINVKKTFQKPENKIDIVEFIKSFFNKNIDNIEFVAEKVDEETIFKVQQILKSFKLMKIYDANERNSKVYDEINEYLTKDFINKNYCDFKNDKCVAQRNHQFYPMHGKDGCCYTSFKKCTNLENGNCKVQCMPCKLFSCPYLTKKGIGYWGSEMVLLNVFFNKAQRKHLIFDFYESKSRILKKVLKLQDAE